MAPNSTERHEIAKIYHIFHLKVDMTRERQRRVNQTGIIGHTLMLNDHAGSFMRQFTARLRDSYDRSPNGLKNILI